MICPLLAIATPGDMKQAHRSLVCCAKENCAWWMRSAQSCAVPIAAANLAGLVAIGDKMLEQMPQDERARARP